MTYDYDSVGGGLPDPRDAYDHLVAFVARWGDGDLQVLEDAGIEDPPFLHTRDIDALLQLGRPDCEWRVEGMEYRGYGGRKRTEPSVAASEAVFTEHGEGPQEARELVESLIPARGGHLVRRFLASSPWVAAGSAHDRYREPMTEPTPETTEVSVETPAKNVETTEVVDTPETAAAAEPDAVTEGLEVESKEQPST